MCCRMCSWSAAWWHHLWLSHGSRASDVTFCQLNLKSARLESGSCDSNGLTYIQKPSNSRTMVLDMNMNKSLILGEFELCVADESLFDSIPPVHVTPPLLSCWYLPIKRTPLWYLSAGRPPAVPWILYLVLLWSGGSLQSDMRQRNW